ncbi:MAG: hypothetical protein ACYT04_39405 [Nostoc sp.]
MPRLLICDRVYPAWWWQWSARLLGVVGLTGNCVAQRRRLRRVSKLPARLLGVVGLTGNCVAQRRRLRRVSKLPARVKSPHLFGFPPPKSHEKISQLNFGLKIAVIIA